MIFIKRDIYVEIFEEEIGKLLALNAAIIFLVEFLFRQCLFPQGKSLVYGK